MHRASFLAAALLAFPAVVIAQPRLESVGIAVGATSDFGRGLTQAGTSASRQVSIGIPIRFHLTGTDSYSIGVIGNVEWSYAPAEVRGEGMNQIALGPEVRTYRGSVDLGVAGIVGLIQRRADSVDDGNHRQYGLEVGGGFSRNDWRVGYSYRRAWVRDVPHAFPACGPADDCRFPAVLEAPSTEHYDRHAISVSWRR